MRLLIAKYGVPIAAFKFLRRGVKKPKVLGQSYQTEFPQKFPAGHKTRYTQRQGLVSSYQNPVNPIRLQKGQL